MSDENITFSFGRNWHDYVATVADREAESARQDIEFWLGSGRVEGRTVLDIGSGSGLHSLAFLNMKASRVRSFDADPYSVQSTRSLWEKAGSPEAWTVGDGSILDDAFLEALGHYDIVYSWGVLHHTGAMWQAVGNAAALVRPGGQFFISLYASGPRYEADLALKRKYNAASETGKRMMEWRWIANVMLGRLLRGRNPFAWNEKYVRGMNVFHDLRDWLGGLPYEVASEDEVVVFLRKRGFVLERIRVNGEGSCNIYVFSVPA